MIRRFCRYAVCLVALSIPALPWAKASIVSPLNAAEKPKRIVSLNVCTDQLVVMLAKRQNIASITFLGADPEISPNADKAKGLYLNKGRAEEILSLKPDLVLASSYTFRPTLTLLKQLGIRVIEVPAVQTLAAARAQILRVANEIGEAKAGIDAVAHFDRRMDKLQKMQPSHRPNAIVYHANGYTSGKGTLINEILELGGFENFAGQFDVSGYGYLPLELLVRHSPDFVVLEQVYRGSPALAQEIFRHPALIRKAKTWQSVSIPLSRWSCPGPSLLEAAERLAAARSL